jgi:beta-lactam-binding protein with PASTA domain
MIVTLARENRIRLIGDLGNVRFTMRYAAYFWLFPFTAFLGGYFLADYFLPTKKVATPALIGLPIQKALELLADKQLYPHLVEEVLDPDLPAGTIISQKPTAHTPVRPGQSILIAVSKQPAKPHAPQCNGQTLASLEKKASTLGIKLRIYHLESHYPIGTCIGQWPAPDTELVEPKMLIYISAGNNKPVMIPDFRGRSLAEATDFCQQHDIPMAPPRTTSAETLSSEADIIIDQRPLPGSLLQKESITLQFQVQQGA